MSRRRMGDSTKFLEAVSALLWPIIVGLLLWRLFPAIKGIVSSRNFSVKVGGAEISVQDATEQIRTQIEDLQKQVIALRGGQAPQDPPAPRGAATRIPEARAPARTNRILWVDDKPSNNAMELAQMRNEGVLVEQVCSTTEALAALGSGGNYAAVVSDMGRFEGGVFREQAGLTLLAAMRKRHFDHPFMVYTSKRTAPRIDEEVQARGGHGATASPIELMEWIGRAVGN